MIFRSACLMAILGLASAGVNPEIHVGVSANDKSGYSGGIQPSVKWSTEGKAGDYEYEGGVDMRAEDLSSANVPFNVWGSVKRDLGGWNLKAKLNSHSDDLQQLNVDVEARGGPADTQLRAQGSVNAGNQRGELNEVGLTQNLEAPGGGLSLSPRYNLASGKADIRVEYSMDDTRVTVDANEDQQKVTVAQRIDDDNEIAPSITSDGDVEIRYRRNMGDGVMTANYRPNDSTSLKYEEGPWTATADIPMDGFYKFNEGAKVAFRRSVSVQAS